MSRMSRFVGHCRALDIPEVHLADLQKCVELITKPKVMPMHWAGQEVVHGLVKRRKPDRPAHSYPPPASVERDAPMEAVFEEDLRVDDFIIVAAHKGSTVGEETFWLAIVTEPVEEQEEDVHVQWYQACQAGKSFGTYVPSTYPIRKKGSKSGKRAPHTDIVARGSCLRVFVSADKRSTKGVIIDGSKNQSYRSGLYRFAHHGRKAAE
jgi:hypothetical protein